MAKHRFARRGAHEFQDAVSDPLRFAEFGVRLGFLLLLRGSFHAVNFVHGDRDSLPFLFGIEEALDVTAAGSSVAAICFGVIHPAEILRHQVAEDKVDKVDDRIGRTEVFIKGQHLGVVIRLADLHPALEQHGIRQTEAEDALLDVAHDEEVLVAHDGAHHRLLQTVEVLRLVDQKMGASDLRRDGVILGKQVKRMVLHVGEVQDFLLRFDVLIILFKLADEIDDGQNLFARSCRLRNQLLVRLFQTRRASVLDA